MEKTTKDSSVSAEPADAYEEGTQTAIYVDPVKEAAARKKFDMYVVPVSVIFLVLSTLDRNNVSGALIYVVCDSDCC